LLGGADQLRDAIVNLGSDYLSWQYEGWTEDAAAAVKACVADKMEHLVCTDRLSSHPEQTIRDLCSRTPPDAASPWCAADAEIGKRDFESSSFVGWALLFGISVIVLTAVLARSVGRRD
jgi:hypothetical protein